MDLAGERQLRPPRVGWPRGGVVGVALHHSCNFVPHTMETDPNPTAFFASPLTMVSEVAGVGIGSLYPPGTSTVWSFPAAAGARAWAVVDTGGAQHNGATSRDSTLALVATDRDQRRRVGLRRRRWERRRHGPGVAGRIDHCRSTAHDGGHVLLARRGVARRGARSLSSLLDRQHGDAAHRRPGGRGHTGHHRRTGVRVLPFVDRGRQPRGRLLDSRGTAWGPARGLRRWATVEDRHDLARHAGPPRQRGRLQRRGADGDRQQRRAVTRRPSRSSTGCPPTATRTTSR